MSQTDKISVYGGFGFVGGEFCRKYPDEVIRIEKWDLVPKTNRVLYFISTTDNYNVYDSSTLDIETNLLHLMDVLDACHKTFGNNFEFNFISSWFVYGKVSSALDVPITEDSYCNPTGFYSITKRAAEQLLISYCETFDIQYRILRLANVLGSKDSKVSKKKNALQFLIDKLIQNEDIELYNGGKFHRDYIDVRDCVRAIKLVISSEINERVFNISNGKSYMFKDLIEFARTYSASKSNVWEKLDTPVFHSIVQSEDIFLSNHRLAKLGYEPEYTIWKTIESIINDYKR